MLRLELSTQLGYEVLDAGCDFIFNIHAAHTPRQTVVHESLQLSQYLPVSFYADPATQNHFLRLRAAAVPFTLNYCAVLDITHFEAAPQDLPELSAQALPGEVLTYLSPSRYCQSDRLMNLASQKFGQLPMGYSRAQAICDWVRQHVRFQSNSNTSAIDAAIERVGVCRDLAHLMIALCRAVNMRAWMASGMDYGADPVLGPPDFHAYGRGLFVRWQIRTLVCVRPVRHGDSDGFRAPLYRARRRRHFLRDEIRPHQCCAAGDQHAAGTKRAG